MDFRLALRSLRRAPTYALSAIAALALAIGANAALFSLIEATLLRPFPYRDPEQLLIVRERNAKFENLSVAYLNYRDWRAQTRDVFSQMAGFVHPSMNLTGAGDPERLSTRMVGADFFDALAARPQLGRTFVAADDAPGAARTAVLSNGLWQRRFASDPRIVGQSITLDGDSYTVIGVMPAGFRFLSPVDAYVPMGLWAEQFNNRGSHPGITVLARMKPGVTLERARAALDGVAARLEKEYPQTNTGSRVRAVTLRDDQTGEFRTALYVLWAAVTVVLLIAAANVANLALARAAARGPELAIRAALGAGRGRIARELLTESVILSVLGGALGVLLARWALDALLPWVPELLRRNADVKLNGAVLAFTMGVSIVTGLAFGALPALRASRADVDTLLRDAGATDSQRRRSVRSALVVAEIALSLALLIGAGLLIRSYANVAAADVGFQPHGVLVLSLNLPPPRYPDGDAIVRFERELRARLDALPGVHAAAVSQTLPLFEDNSTDRFWVDGTPRPPPGEGVQAMQYTATPGFLPVLGARLLRGRDLRDESSDVKSPVMLIDDALGRRLFGSENPVGHRLRFAPEDVGDLRGVEIVGVYAHMTHFAPGEPDDGAVAGAMILPFALKARVTPQWSRLLRVMLRADGDLTALATAARREVSALDPELAVYDVTTLDAALDEALTARKFSLLLLGLFAALALTLAAIGIYGVMSYGVVQRTREIGVRMALGAEQRAILRLVVGDGLRLAALGVVLGGCLAVGLSRALRGMLFGVGALDPIAYVTVAATLVAVALLASWLPARRAARVDPAIALRAE